MIAFFLIFFLYCGAAFSFRLVKVFPAHNGVRASMSTNQFHEESLTLQEIERIAMLSNLTITSVITGPQLRLDVFTTNSNIPVGYLTAFIRPFPFKYFHLDTIQVKNHRQHLGYKRKTWNVIDGSSISFIMGTWSLIWAKQQGCKVAELLAVNDNNTMHDILVRLYSR